MTTPKIPRYHDLMWPALQATKELGGSATVGEMNERAMESAGVTEEQQSVPHKDGRMSEVEYRLHWARTHLKGIGALENSARGVWAITDRGRSMSEPEMRSANKAWRESLRKERLERRSSQATEAESEDAEGEAEGSWKDQLIARLLELPPDGFEKGLLITTGSFTRDAQAEATRDGGTPASRGRRDRQHQVLRRVPMMAGAR